METSQQKPRMCENCDTVFYGCKVFNGAQLITNVCSQQCFEKLAEHNRGKSCFNCGTDDLDRSEYYCKTCEPDKELRNEFSGYL